MTVTVFKKNHTAVDLKRSAAHRFWPTRCDRCCFTVLHLFIFLSYRGDDPTRTLQAPPGCIPATHSSATWAGCLTSLHHRLSPVKQADSRVPAEGTGCGVHKARA